MTRADKSRALDLLDRSILRLTEQRTECPLTRQAEWELLNECVSELMRLKQEVRDATDAKA